MGEDDLPDLDPAALARAEAALAALADSYRAWSAADCARLLEAHQTGDRSRVFTIAHDIKGQAATFGFPEITRRAAELCRALEAGAETAGLVAALTEAMKAD